MDCRKQKTCRRPAVLAETQGQLLDGPKKRRKPGTVPLTVLVRVECIGSLLLQRLLLHNRHHHDIKNSTDLQSGAVKEIGYFLFCINEIESKNDVRKVTSILTTVSRTKNASFCSASIDTSTTPTLHPLFSSLWRL